MSAADDLFIIEREKLEIKKRWGWADETNGGSERKK